MEGGDKIRSLMQKKKFIVEVIVFGLRQGVGNGEVVGRFQDLEGRVLVGFGGGWKREQERGEGVKCVGFRGVGGIVNKLG